VTDDEQYDKFIARIRAERVAAGLEPTIQSPVVYRLLSAVLDAQLRKSDRQTTESN
jgi:hypothetical protein